MWRRFEALPRVRSSLASHAESQRNQHKRTLFAQPANQLFAVVCGFPPALDDVRNLLFGSHYSGAHRGASAAVPRGGGDSTVNQEITAGEKAAVQNHEQRADRSHFVWSAGASSRGLVDHAAVPLATWPCEFVLCEGGRLVAFRPVVEPVRLVVLPRG